MIKNNLSKHIVVEIMFIFIGIQLLICLLEVEYYLQ